MLRAVLNLDSAMAHLYHFCALLPLDPYVDRRPAFAFDKDDITGRLLATVTLPNSVDPAVRRASGLDSWLTERMAKRDAAFEAYIALYKAGLVNENLLPLKMTKNEDIEIETRPSLVETSEQFNPWRSVCESWQRTSNLIHSTISFHEAGGKELQMCLTLPVNIPQIRPFNLFWNDQVNFTVSINECGVSMILNEEALKVLQDATHTLMLSGLGRQRIEDGKRDFAALFSPTTDQLQLQLWVKQNERNHQPS
jgi:hypothetical protein